MADCCEDKACAIQQLQARQTGTLQIVLVINAVMFVVVLVAGILAGSSALLADCLDNLGDALTYALSLYAVGRTERIKGSVAMIKAVLILSAALFVAAQIIYKRLNPALPVFETMSAIGVLALAANGTCFALLWKHRHEDINMSSVWECSHNDIAANVAVLIAAAGVWLTATAWPDLVIGSLLVLIFLRSALRVFRGARQSLGARVLTN
jgi:Co/Zn/Cd efflux system component